MKVRRGYHGTGHAELIFADGATSSGSGGGQMGLRGFWMSPDEAVADRYGRCAVRFCSFHGERCPGATLEVLEADLSELNLADLRDYGLDKLDALAALGVDWLTADGLARIRELSPWGLTVVLVEQGFDGAVIVSTTDPRGEGVEEIVVFDPSKVELRRTIC